MLDSCAKDKMFSIYLDEILWHFLCVCVCVCVHGGADIKARNSLTLPKLCQAAANPGKTQGSLG